MVLHEDFYQPRMPMHREQSDTPEAMPYSDEQISTYETTNGFPFTASKLGYNENIKIDPYVEMKVRAVDEHIQQVIRDERLRDSKVGYDTVFKRLCANLGEPYERMIQGGNQGQLLESLFMNVALSNKMSSKTFLKEFTRKYSERRVSILKQQLKEGLIALKA